MLGGHPLSLCMRSYEWPSYFFCRLRRDAGRLERRLASYMQHQLKLPPLALSAIFLVRPVVYLYILLWLACCPIAAKFEVRICIIRLESCSSSAASLLLYLLYPYGANFEAVVGVMQDRVYNAA